MSRVHISGGLFACIVAVYIQVAQMLFLPGPVSKIIGQEAWLAVALAGLVGMGMGLFAVWVSLRHPRLGPAQVARRLMGKWFGGTIGLCYAGFFLWTFSLILRDIVDFGQMILLPGTPGLAIILLFAAISLYSVWHGLEPLLRISFQTIVAVAVAVLLLPILEAREFSIKQLSPFLYRGVPALLQATAVAIPWWGESVAVMSLVPHMKHPRQAYRWLSIGLGAGILIQTILVLQTMMVLGAQLPDRFVFPIYYMLHLVSIAHIIERIELILVTIWLSGMFVKSALYLYISAEAAAQSLGLRSLRVPAVVFTVAGIALSQIWRNLLDLIHWTSSPSWVIWVVAFELGFPILLLLASMIRPAHSRGGSANA